MADINQLKMALIAADRAGDTEAATVLAHEIKRLSTVDASPEPRKLNENAMRMIEDHRKRHDNSGMWGQIKEGAHNAALGLLQGAGDIPVGGLELAGKGLELFPGMEGNVVSNRLSELAREREDAYQDLTGDSALAGVSRFAGSAVLPGGALGTAARGAGALKTAATASGLGAGHGLLTPVAKDENYWGEKAIQTGIGGALGVVLPGVTMAGSRLVRGLFSDTPSTPLIPVCIAFSPQ